MNKDGEFRKRIINGANNYADIAINEGTAAASRKFLDDYTTGYPDGMWNCTEHIVIMYLVPQYIKCKKGIISRKDCAVQQNRILSMLED